jgi:sugar lactone lactonase YvrE
MPAALPCKYDLQTGKVLKRYDLQRVDGQQHVLGDMTLSPAGDVYIGDASGAVYMISHSKDELEILVPPGEMVGPQTPALTPDGKRLFVADYGRGIAIVDLASRAVSWLATPKNLGAAGIDGFILPVTS